MADAESGSPTTAAGATQELLDVVVAAIGGEPRPGQREMAGAVAQALDEGRHLLVQAGTGTGKSLGYLVPAVAHVAAGSDPVIVSTATLALQHQLVSRDLPAVQEALVAADMPGVTFAVLKGRANYVCRQRIDGVPGDQMELDTGTSSGPAGKLEEQAARVREWAQATTTGDRDEVPDIDARVWQAFSVTARECVGATKCPAGSECFAERARAEASRAQIVVTNHALLALDAVESIAVLPDHSAVIVDEGHELAERTTGALTSELSGPGVLRAATLARHSVSREAHEALSAAATTLAGSLMGLDDRLEPLPDSVRAALGTVRDAAHACLSELAAASEGSDADALAARQRVVAAVEDVHDVAGEILSAGDERVIWAGAGTGARGTTALRSAPLSVAGPLRSGLLDRSTVVLTSATLSLGGDFTHAARDLGLGAEDEALWNGIDVGSPFDFARQGILYVATDLPRPGPGGPSSAALDRMVALVMAAGGRALVLYSSWRGVEAAAERLERAGIEALVQRRGDAVGGLVRRFAADPGTPLVGTMSLWQGVDVPGDACILVVIDRIPFPRPNDPLVAARSRRIEQAGGSGFAAVSVPRAALLLAQGTGRLIRRTSDRGVVAVLDPRLVTAGYGRYLRASLPPLWSTTDAETAVGALRRLAEAAGADQITPDGGR